MKELIDKSAVVAEIKGLIRANELYLSEPKTDEIRFQKVGAYSVLNDLLHFLDTLEVKKVVAEQKGICNGMFNTIIGDTTWHIKMPLDKAGLKNGDKVKMFITKEK